MSAVDSLPEKVADPDPSSVQAGDYEVDTVHTRVVFSVSHLGLSNWNGDFSGVTGSLTIDPAKPSMAKLLIQIPVSSVSTTNAHVDDELKGKDWMDAERFPSITFVSTAVSPRDRASADIQGDLTFHGVTKSISLAVHFNGAGVNPFSKRTIIGFEGAASFKRSDFGVTAFVPLIGDLVTLRVSAEFARL